MHAITRTEHLAWCKQRAFEYLDRGELVNAWASFCSDMNKHEGTANVALFGLIMVVDVMPAIEQSDAGRLRRAIDGFN